MQGSKADMADVGRREWIRFPAHNERRELSERGKRLVAALQAAAAEVWKTGDGLRKGRALRTKKIRRE